MTLRNLIKYYLHCVSPTYIPSYTYVGNVSVGLSWANRECLRVKNKIDFLATIVCTMYVHSI
jgi:hypothetical protein